MNLDHVRTFLEVAACGNFNRAAETLNVTQSTVSARIKALEERFGHPLFQRGRAGAELTAALRAPAEGATAPLPWWRRLFGGKPPPPRRPVRTRQERDFDLVDAFKQRGLDRTVFSFRVECAFGHGGAHGE